MSGLLACMALMCHETCKPFQLACIIKIAGGLHPVSPKSTLIAKRYIMLLAVSFILELGFSGLLKF